MVENPSYIDEFRIEVHESNHDLAEEVYQVWMGLDVAIEDARVELNFGRGEPNKFDINGILTVSPQQISVPASVNVEPEVLEVARAVKVLRTETDCVVQEINIDARDRPIEFYLSGHYQQ